MAKVQAIHVRPTEAHKVYVVFKTVNMIGPPIGTRYSQSELEQWIFSPTVDLVMEE